MRKWSNQANLNLLAITINQLNDHWKWMLHSNFQYYLSVYYFSLDIIFLSLHDCFIQLFKLNDDSTPWNSYISWRNKRNTKHIHSIQSAITWTNIECTFRKLHAWFRQMIWFASHSTVWPNGRNVNIATPRIWRCYLTI